MTSMSRLRLVRVAIAWCLLLAAAEAAAAPVWRRVVTPHFVVVGEVGERQLRDVARRLEEFSSVVGRMLPNARIAPPAPATVVVFASRASFLPFTPRVDGTPRQDLGGYFQPGRDRHVIALVNEAAEEAYRIVFHELTHLIVSNTAPNVPVWFNEGLAEFYGTFALLANGRQGTIGTPVPQHVRLLRQRGMPLEALFAVTRESAEYNERDRASVFYAQSWALVHYLLVGRPERAPQLFAFLDRLRQGASVSGAFRDSFDVDIGALERELRTYVHQSRFAQQVFQLDDLVVSEHYPVAAMTEAAAEAVLGDLLVRIGRPEEGRPRLERALAPHLSDAHGGLGALAWKAGRQDEALAHLTAAVESDPDNGHAHALHGLVVVSDGKSLEDPAARDTARRVLTRATEIGPEWPDPWFLLAQLHAVSGQVDEARACIDRAMALAPGRLEYRLVLAQVHAVAGELGLARDVLGPLLAQRDRPEVAGEARRLLAALAARQRAATERPGDPAAGTPADPATTAPPGEDRRRSILRTTAAGEARARGRWVDLECRGQAFVATVEIDGERRRYAAPAEAVELISHRGDRRGAVTCGPREAPEDVVVTWREGEAFGPDGLPRLVALEILPE